MEAHDLQRRMLDDTWQLSWFRSPPRRRTRSAGAMTSHRLSSRGPTVVTLLGLVVGATLLLPACSGCESAELAATPIGRSALGGPVTLEARLTSGGSPVRGAAVIFFVLSDGQNTTSRGRAIGDGITDSDGFARVSFSRGLAALEPPSYVINGYSVEFRATGSVPGREGELCRTQGEFLFV